MKKKVWTVLMATLVMILGASAMTLKTRYTRVSDTGCNKCVISNDDNGATRKCGICGGFLSQEGQAEVKPGNWLQATFKCDDCNHPSVWKW